MKMDIESAIPNAANLDSEKLSDTEKHILLLGTEINAVRAGLIEDCGQALLLSCGLHRQKGNLYQNCFLSLKMGFWIIDSGSLSTQFWKRGFNG